MAINAPFFLDAANLTVATSVYLDSSLTNIAPDGFYRDGTVVRQQSSGILLAAEACASCCSDCVPGTDITIGTQQWSNCNLDVTTYRNGDPIPEVTDPTAWAALTTGAWCYYNNITANGTTYGKLYNWHAVNDPRGLAPINYHIPTDAELTTLTDYLGGDSVAGGKMKEAGLCHWLTPNTDATDSSGFTCLPGGYRYYNGTFNEISQTSYFWSTSEVNTTDAFSRLLNYNSGYAYSTNNNKKDGFSVRLIRDEETTIPLNWSFSELSAEGEMVLYVNSIAVVTRTASDFGTYSVNVGDVISVSVTCAGCFSPQIKANAYCTGLITDSSCTDTSSSFTSAGYTVISGDIGTTLELNTFAQCASGCI
jgi:uncharacterized protein (TIGR02145 family)